MSGRRSSFPQRIQQIASGGRQVPSSIILETEPPPKVKEFIDRVIKSPLHDIAIPLSGFRWEYNKGNFHHWRPLFLHFDTYFRTNLSIRKDLLLADDVIEENIFPKHSVLQILRVMQIILENCHNKNSFSGLEHFKLLLASTDPEILIASLETLSALVKVHPSKLHVSGKLIGCGSINSFLLSLAQGWGSKEEGLGLLSCVIENERILHEGLRLFPSDNENNFDGTQYRLGSTLHFEFNGSPFQDSEQSSAKKNSNVCAIHIPDLHLRKEDDLMILKQCVEQFNVPSQHRFSLLTRIRYAHSLRSPRICRLYCRICILAFIVLVQSDDAKNELVSFFANEPEYTNELIRLVQYEDSVPAIVRALSMQALGAQLAAYASSHDHARVLSSSSIIAVGGNRMVLLSVLQKAVLSLSNSTDPSSSLFVDALLQFFLLHVLSSSSSGSSIRGSGMIAPLLPLLEDNDPAHTHLVCSAVKTLQKLMEYSSPAVSLFKDLGGVELLAQRLHTEVQRVVGTAGGNSNTIVEGDSLKSEEDHLYSQKQLIKALLKALGSATYSPANSTRSQANDNTLLVSLAAIFDNVNIFGGEIYFSAVTVMSEVIHKDPTCYPVLDELGLPSAFISSVVSGILPSCKALICVPNGLGAICLNVKGLEAVKENAALKFLIDAFTTRKYLVAMNEGVVLLANAMEELLRHVSSLRSAGVDIILEVISRLVSLGENKIDEFPAKMNGATSMETDLEHKENQGHDLVNAMEFTADGIADEQFLQLCIFHTMVLVHRTMENSETCRIFVERGGLSSLMKLLLRPSITQSAEGMPIALHSTLVFKGFTQHHSAPLASAFTSSLRDYLEEALNIFSSISGSFILGAGTVADNGIFSSLSVIEFLLLLGSSKDNRWMNALFTEFGHGSRDILENIGRVHREVLWQIALLEDSKIEPDVATRTNEEPRSNLAVGESEELRFSSSSHYSDPLMRRRGSGWSFESRLSDLISTYRDLGRPAGRLRRLRIDGSSTRHHTSSSQLLLSNLADASTVSKTEADKQSSHCFSHHDMMRSLSYHISHLFMEFGKAMLLSSRRENNHLNLPSSVTSVASSVASIALDHLNFSGHATAPSEKEVSTKCRYLGKVVDFIDEILLDRPESCNPIMVNCFYNQGVIQATLATFEATSQLLFAVKGVPSSPMEMDDTSFKQVLMKEPEDTWIYGPLASYCALMDHLATSSFIFTSSTKQFLEYQLTNGTFQTPRDAEVFVKMLQSKVFKAVLPIWTHPHFAECDLEFITGMIKIMRHAYSGAEVRVSSGGSRAKPIGPPLDESAISVIVEMGFSRSRAEEALRQVGTNRVDIATEWLFLHPEEPQEDDELAQALAMSLGSSDPSLNEAPTTKSNTPCDEGEPVQLPPVDEMLLACLRLLQAKESLAYPVRDLFMMISSQNGGQNRSKVLTFIIDNVKQCSMASDRLRNSLLSALFHVLALILHEDVMAREVMMKAGLVKIATDLLYEWNMTMCDSDKLQVPKWVMTCFLSLDRMLQVDLKLSPDITEQLRNDDLVNQTSVIIDENRRKDIQLDMHEQKKLLELCNRCICNQFPSETMHAVLQLCATLTKVHTVAVSFLEAGGLHALLSLPTHSLFPGYSTVAAAIIRHILEDPLTLQQVMELEIRHSLITVTRRHSNVRATPRNFVQNLASVISRDPGVFLRAARSVCQIEVISDRPYIVLKDHEKEKTKEKEKEKSTEKEQPAIDVKNPGGNVFMNPDNGHKLADSNAKTIKNHRKAPQCFSTVIDLLLDSIVTFAPFLESDSLIDDPLPNPSLVDMDIDSTSAKGKGKAISLPTEDSKIANLEASASLAKAVFVMKLLTDILLTYTSSIYVLLRRDTEISSSRGSSLPNAGLFYHVLHKFLPYSGIGKKNKKVERDWRCKLASRAKQFLVASSIRSTEGRRRVFSEINNVFSDFFEKSNGCRAADTKMHTFVDLLNDILAARSPTGSHISGEASATFIDVGLVCSLTRTLQVLDLDDADSQKIVTGIIKALEMVSKEYVHSSDRISKKGGDSLNPSSNQNHVNSSYSDGDRFQSIETTSIGVAADHIDPFISIQTSGGSLDSVADDMDHDRDADEGFLREAEGDTMHGSFEDGEGLGNGMATVEIRFDVHRHDDGDGEGGEEEEGEEEEEEEDDDDDDDDDDDMSADEVDVDDDEDEDENNDLEDEDQQMMHPETDHDDHEMDGEEFDDDMLEEDDEDGDEDDDDVENGRYTPEFDADNAGTNVFDHIEVLSEDVPGNALPVMPLDILDSRRSSRTTSIYNLLGGAGDHGFQFDHPLLEEPSVTQIVQNRYAANVIDTAFLDRNHESLSQTDALYRTIRGGRQSHRFNVWLDDNLHHDRSNISSVLPGIEELLVSQLRQPTLEQPSEQDALKDPPKEKDERNQVQISEAEAGEEILDINASAESMTSPSSRLVTNGSANAGIGPSNEDLFQERGTSNAIEQVSAMQYESSGVALHDVEAVSQANSGGEATLVGSLHNVEVEIGSANGQDEGERQGPPDSALNDLQLTFLERRSSGGMTPVNGRDTGLVSVGEVPQNSSEEADQNGLQEENQPSINLDSDSIDPAFLEALPEELRAEVLASQQTQVAQPSGEQSQAEGDIDPEFLAALPPDIREEVLAQQRAQRRRQSQELDGQPVEMDPVSLIGTFPSDLREDVLLTSPENLLASLTPALVAEANILRERFSSPLFRRQSQRSESSRRFDIHGSSFDRNAGDVASHRSVGMLAEANGSPLVDTDGLKSLIRLLRIVQPVYKGQLQKLLLNLCAHRETRKSLVEILMDILILDLRGPTNSFVGAVEPPFRLYACQSNIIYSRPQFSEGVPPLVSRRILETLNHLARYNQNIAKLLLQQKLPGTSLFNDESCSKGRGKSVVVMEEDKPEDKKGYHTIDLLLRLLNQPLYMRSAAHLEELLKVLDVTMLHVESDSALSIKSGASVEQPSTSEATMQGTQSNVNTVEISSGGDGKLLQGDDGSGSSISAGKKECSDHIVLLNLPHAELRLMCSLLAREGLSDNVYVHVAEVMKKLVTLAPAYCYLFITEIANLMYNLTMSAVSELHLHEDAEKALLNTSSTNGITILRVLRALSSLVAALHEKKNPHLFSEKEYSAALSKISDINVGLESLWQQLSKCISKIEISSEPTSDLAAMSSSFSSTGSRVIPPLPAGMQNILPYIESFFVTCEKLCRGQPDAVQDFGTAASDIDDAATSSGGQKSSPLNAKVDEKNIAFVKFSERHKKLLNAFIRQNPGLLERSFSLMLKVPRVIDFDNKRSHFRSKMKHQHDHHHSPVRISVRRAYILEDSYNKLRMRSPQDLKGRLVVHFQGEEGIDAGGLTREWYQLLSRVIFDKNALLFTTVGSDSTFQPNPNSVYQTEHLSYFKFVGRVVGKALFDGHLLDVHFTRSFYKHILGVKVTYHDIEAIDPGYYKNLKWMLENDITEVLDLTFSLDADEEKLILYERAEVTDSELIPDGRNIRVTEENKHEYVDRVVEHRLTTAIRPQINAFMEGINELIPRDLISIFNDKELELLISGLPDIDLDDLRANTDYAGYSNASPVIRWFWGVVQGFSKEDKARFLQFVTGTSKVPLEGFSALQGISGPQRFQIHKAYASPDHLPSAHTCFNQLDLPEYNSREQLQERLLLAIHEGSEGFGFG